MYGDSISFITGDFMDRDGFILLMLLICLAFCMGLCLGFWIIGKQLDRLFDLIEKKEGKV